MSHLRIEGVGKRYGAVEALRDVTLAAPSRSRTAVVGPSGSGKTTLLRIIAGFERPDVGSIRLDDDLLADGASAVPAHRREIGYVTQDGALFPYLSVAGNIAFGLEERGRARTASVERLMELVDLDRALMRRRPHELSGGQQQRVALARALARQPRLMLLDEPFSALDAGLREEVRQAVMRALEQADVTAILVTHDRAEALSFADQLAVFRNGRLAQVGPPEALYRAPIDEETARFMGRAAILPARLGDGVADCAFGRVAAATHARRGESAIMLRPEQFTLASATTGDHGVPICVGTVESRVFVGATCDVTVRWRRGDEGGSLTLALSSVDAPPPGALVRLAVRGVAHVFPDR